VVGFLAWLSWFFIHLVFLVGFRNRISAVAKWAYAFFTMRRYARLITTPHPVLPAPGTASSLDDYRTGAGP
jgi:NADH dehydrogenase